MVMRESVRERLGAFIPQVGVSAPRLLFQAVVRQISEIPPPSADQPGLCGAVIGRGRGPEEAEPPNVGVLPVPHVMVRRM